MITIELRGEQEVKMWIDRIKSSVKKIEKVGADRLAEETQKSMSEIMLQDKWTGWLGSHIFAYKGIKLGMAMVKTKEKTGTIEWVPGPGGKNWPRGGKEYATRVEYGGRFGKTHVRPRHFTRKSLDKMPQFIERIIERDLEIALKA